MVIFVGQEGLEEHELLRMGFRQYHYIPVDVGAANPFGVWDLSRKREISEQFVWLNRQYGETEAQLSRSAITPSIRADSSQDEGL